MEITLELLRNLGACKRTRDYFFRTYGFSAAAPLRQVWDEWVGWRESANYSNEDRIWLACRLLEDKKRDALAFRFAGQAMRFAGITEYADNVTLENWRDASERARELWADSDYQNEKINGARICAHRAACSAIDKKPIYAELAAEDARRVAPSGQGVAALTEQVQWCAEALFS